MVTTSIACHGAVDTFPRTPWPQEPWANSISRPDSISRLRSQQQTCGIGARGHFRAHPRLTTPRPCCSAIAAGDRAKALSLIAEAKSEAQVLGIASLEAELAELELLAERLGRNPSALKLRITSRTRSSLVNATFAIPVTPMPGG